MRDRSPGGAARAPQAAEEAELPPPEVIDFIRYCYRRRLVGWPEIYDDMCAVAARREFKGWDHADLSEHGVTFSLLDTPRLSAWVRAVLPRTVAVGSASGSTPAIADP